MGEVNGSGEVRRRRPASVVLTLAGLLVGLAVGTVGTWAVVTRSGDVAQKLASLEARVREGEAIWRGRLGALEANVEGVRGETAAVGQRVEDLTRMLSVARQIASAPPTAARPTGPEPATRKAAVPALRLTGVMRIGDQRTALVEDTRDQYVAHVGMALPEGRVVEITDDTVTIEQRSGERLKIRMGE